MKTNMSESGSSFSAAQLHFLDRKGLFLTFAKIHTSVETQLITSWGMCRGGCVLCAHECVFARKQDVQVE